MSLLRGLSVAAFVALFSFSDVYASDNVAINKYYSKEIDLVVNDTMLKNLPMNPLFYENYLLVPSREVFVPLGAYVEYEKNDKKVFILYNEKLLTLQVNNKFAMVGGEIIELDIPPKIIANKLMIPLRSVSENLGLEVVWDSKHNAAYVNEVSNGLGPAVLSAEVGDIDGASEIDDGPTVDEPFEDISTTINDIKIPNKDEKNQFIIGFSGPIGRFEKDFIKDNRLILDFYGTNYSVGNTYNNLDNEAVKEIRIGKDTSDGITKTRIVFELNKSIEYSSTISEDKRYVFVDFSILKETANQNTIPTNEQNEISFNNATLSISKNGQGIDIKDIIEFDDYNNKKYSFVFPEGFSISYNNSRLNVGDSKVDYFEFSTVNGLCAATLYEKQILSPVISEDQENIYITLVQPKERYNKIVIIDPGHGGHDPGAQGFGRDEKDIIFSIANKVGELFKDVPDIKIYLTRTEDIFITRPDRVAFANELGDLFISVHANASTNQAAKGIETYYYNNGIVNSLGVSSKKIAEIAQKNILRATNGVDRKVKTEAFDVIKFTNIPAILMEVGFISNEAESNLIASDSYQQLVAESIKETIYDSFEIYTPKR
ncbi:MAG: N-acetylmuramoyl-L-alanine amidase family protein [Clostridiales bacterium]|jgi:N-acetylmuramoyl-L-alanine amidase|nr:N-acetylmuramoyl-L-alanine amidase family protein [Clostridiales bacterium]